ncbi:MAG TPA: 2-phosphosulfolactate phosphatase [Gemmatimonadales bacterium]
MRVEVAFSPAGLAASGVTGRTVFVVDTLRAGTTVCAALAHGARGVIPVASIEEAMKLSQTLERGEVLLTGERSTVRIEGFDLGNSPLEMTEATVRGKTLVMTTTNGTRAILATAGAEEVYLAAAVNLGVAGARAREVLAARDDLLVLCAGREHAFALEDAFTAGRLIFEALEGRRIKKGLNDAALVSVDLAHRYGRRWLRPFLLSRAGRELATTGFRDDVLEAALEDRYPVLPQFHDRRITAAPLPVSAAPTLA